MALDFDFPVGNEAPAAPLIWISYNGFERATGENLQTPVYDEKKDRVKAGLAKLDDDFPDWLEEVRDDSANGVILQFRDIEAVRNVESTLRNRGLNNR